MAAVTRQEGRQAQCSIGKEWRNGGMEEWRNEGCQENEHERGRLCPSRREEWRFGGWGLRVAGWGLGAGLTKARIVGFGNHKVQGSICKA